MGTGIQICGLNGCGKSTIGRALAQKIGFHFIDNEDLYFPKSDPLDPYASPRSREDAERLLLQEVKKHPYFVFAAVRGDYGKEIQPLYSCVIMVEVPKEIRLKRIRNRSFQKFGERMMPGGDLHEGEEAFFKMAEARDDGYVEKWLKDVSCPIIRIDGTKPTEENVEYIIRKMNLWILFEGASADG